jgi:hypothetical protein
MHRRRCALDQSAATARSVAPSWSWASH